MSVQLIQGNFGVQFIMGVSFDMSLQDSLQFHFIKPDCITELFVPGVLGTSTITVDGLEFAANTWASYDFVDGDLDQASDGANLWRVDLRYEGDNGTITNARLFSEPASFEVSPALVPGTP